MAGWNFFLALPIIVIGITDHDVSWWPCAVGNLAGDAVVVAQPS
jgi:hypothetical protein